MTVETTLDGRAMTLRHRRGSRGARGAGRGERRDRPGDEPAPKPRPRRPPLARYTRARRSAPLPKPTIADAALELIATERAVTLEHVVTVVLERGLTRAKDPVQAVYAALRDSLLFERLLDGRWTSPLVLLDGMTLTHELTEAEANGSALAVELDTGVIWRIIDRGSHRLLLDGAHDLTRLYSWEAPKRLGDRRHQRAIDGPTGWLPSTPGTFLHLRVDGQELRIGAGSRPGAASRVAERRLSVIARDVIERRIARGMEPVAEIDAILAHALVEAPDLLREPVAPIGQVLRDAGLEVLETLVGLPGTDWRGRGWIALASLFDDEDAQDDEDASDGSEDDLDELLSVAEAVALYRDRFDLDDQEATVAELLLTAIDLEEAGAPMTDPELIQKFAQILDHAIMTQIMAAEAWRRTSVRAFAERVLEGAAPGTTAGVRTVLATVADVEDDPDRAEELLRAALAEDPDFPPALTALATLAEERGDLAGALRLVKQAGVPASSGGRAALEKALAPAGPKVGRNDPCPCGSGRKSKACHPDGVGAVAPNGARLLRWILGVWSERPEIDVAAHELLADAGFRPDHDVPEGSADDTPDEDARWRMAHGLATDIILFDDGDLVDLVRTRGHRLPPGLLALAERWLETDRTLLEVRAVEPGRGLTVRDLLDDRLLTIDDAMLARTVRPLDLFCARPLPDGQGGYLIRDGFGVPRPQREQLAAMIRDGDGTVLLDWLWDPRPNLRVRTPEGDALMFRSAVWVVPGADRARRRLADTPGMRVDGPDRYVLVDDPEGRASIVGTITFEIDEATLEAMSDQRYSRLVKVLRAASPKVRLMRSSRRTPQEAMDAVRSSGPGEGPPIGVRDDLGPEVDAALDAFMRDYEQRWVDEPIPALGGLTPRQALADPDARPKLDALLDDMEWQEREARRRESGRAGSGMRAGRVRQLLGIGGRTQA